MHIDDFSSPQRRHQAKTVAQLKDFVGKLGGLQSEHQSLGLRTCSRSTHSNTFTLMGYSRHTSLRNVGSAHADNRIQQVSRNPTKYLTFSRPHTVLTVAAARL